ncbi:hypothetical protein C2W62_46985, partial [Candidatus Entotheonella serta]
EDIGVQPDGDCGAGRIDPDRQPTLPEPCNPPNGDPAATGDNPADHSWTAREALRTKAFWLIAATTFLAVTSQSAIGFNLVPYLHESANLSTPQAAGVLSLSTLLAISSLGWGYLADQFPPRHCMIGAMLGAVGIVSFLFAVDSLVSAYVFGITWGVLSSSQVLISMILARYFGPSAYGAISGALRPFEAGGLGLGQSLGAVLHDVTGSYSGLILTALGAHLLAAVFMFLARAPKTASYTHL